MKIVATQESINLNLSIDTDFNLDLLKEDKIKQFEQDTLKEVINPILDYETIRFNHNPYTGSTELLQDDIWYQFYFLNNDYNPSYVGGLDYSLVGITHQENAKMLSQFSKGFFKLEFYKTENDEPPKRSNRRLVFSKILSIPIGERVFYTPFSDYISVPIFNGSSIKNKENMSIYWLQDEETTNDTIYSGTTFYMSARFFNSKDGTVVNFINKPKTINEEIYESEDSYFKVIINRTSETYEVYSDEHNMEVRVGKSEKPIKFYESSNVMIPLVSPTPTPTPTPSLPLLCTDIPYIAQIIRTQGSSVSVFYDMVGSPYDTISIEVARDTTFLEKSTYDGIPHSTPASLNLSEDNGTWYFRMRKKCESLMYSTYSNISAYTFPVILPVPPIITDVIYMNKNTVTLSYIPSPDYPCNNLVVTFGRNENNLTITQELPCDGDGLSVDVGNSDGVWLFKLQQEYENGLTEYSNMFVYEY